MRKRQKITSDVQVANGGDTPSRNLYHVKLVAPTHVTKIVRFDWSAVFESFCGVQETCTE